MKDFAGNELKKGHIVVVKPSTRHSFMKFGVVDRVRPKHASVVTEGSEGRYTPQSIYSLGKPEIRVVDGEVNAYIPEGFPLELMDTVVELNK